MRSKSAFCFIFGCLIIVLQLFGHSKAEIQKAEDEKKINESRAENWKECHSSFGVQMIFDEGTGDCVEKPKRAKRQVTVGTPCYDSTDCSVNGMYCNSQKLCDCLSTFVNIAGTCWQKINPDESGCSNDRQCNAVWPGAYCSMGQCKCASNQPAFETNEGKVCLNYGYCPINGNGPKYRSDAGEVETCLDDYECRAGYECICSDQNSNCYNDGVVRFCCPMRGLTCIQGLDEGTTQGIGGGTVTRFYHNPITGNCEPFQYRGAGGNANNFESQEQCESYCKTYCSRGDPEIIDPPTSPPDGALFPSKGTPRSCTGTNSCGTNRFSCEKIGTASFCCPRPQEICSPNGGLDYTNHQPLGLPIPNQPFDEGTSGGSSRTYSRYYYDQALRRCRPFTYLGQGGNLNNFLTQAHCESYCAKTVCDAGEPLKDSSGIANLICPVNACPSTHDCTRAGVCCPKPQTVCSLSKAAGTCGNYVEKWWFNAKTGNCERFLFSGCQGNANNFDSYLDCQNYCRDTNLEPQCPQGKALKDSFDKFILCGGSASVSVCPGNYDCFYDGNTYGCCPTKAFTCTQSFDQGTACGPRVTRWYYNSNQRRCLTFEFNGCDSKPNNFATQQDCEEYCGVGGCPEGGEPFRDARGQYQICGNGISCPLTHYCTQVTLGTASTYNYCCPTKAFICSQPRDSGQLCASTSITRYFFNVGTRNCEAFSYNGCGGNRNSFATIIQCLNYCNSAGCPPGTIALRDTGGISLTFCQAGSLANTCPNDYVCANSLLLGQSVCCGVPASTGKCLAGQTPYFDALTNAELQCQPNIPGSCPSGYLCYFSQTNQVYYCCGTAANRCPQGGSPFIESSTNTPRQCTPGVLGACPTGFRCQATSISVAGIPATTGFCCGEGGFCSNGGSALLSTGQPVTCQPGRIACQSGYVCTFSSANNQYYCCTPGPTGPSVCGAGTPYLVDTRPVVCSSGSQSTNCPPPFLCILNQPTNTFFCCRDGIPGGVGIVGGGGAVVAPRECPPGLSPLWINDTPGQYQYCSPSYADACPIRFICQYVSATRRFICCGPGSGGGGGGGGGIIPLETGCPNNSPYEEFNGQAKLCQPFGYNQCSFGFVCIYNTKIGQNTCCRSVIPPPPPILPPPPQPPIYPGDRYGCPVGISYIYPGTAVPIACKPPYALCPAPFTCFKSTIYSGFQCCSTYSGKLNNLAAEPAPTQKLHSQSLLAPREEHFGNFLQNRSNSGHKPSGATTAPQTAPNVDGSENEVLLQAVEVAFRNFLKSKSVFGDDAKGNKTLRPGDFGCSSDSECQATGEPYARCTAKGRCLCSSHMLVHKGRCSHSCPWPTRNLDGICMGQDPFGLFQDSDLEISKNCSEINCKESENGDI